MNTLRPLTPIPRIKEVADNGGNDRTGITSVERARIYRTPEDVLALAQDVAHPIKLEAWLKFLRDRSAKPGKLPPFSAKPIDIGLQINPS